MFAKGLGLLVSVIGVLWLAIAGAWGTWKYERLEPGWPNYHQRVLFWTVNLHAPGAGSVSALSAQRDAALANLTVCHSNQAVLQGAIRAQNAAVVTLQARGDAMSRSAQTAVQRARVASQRASDLAARILAERVQPGDAAAQCKQAESILRENTQ